MSHAERCPVCFGTGEYIRPPNPMTTAVSLPKICHGCGGKGWIKVEDGERVGFHDVDKFYPPDKED
jgi:DnaJ-class molecular chaperone